MRCIQPTTGKPFSRLVIGSTVLLALCVSIVAQTSGQQLHNTLTANQKAAIAKLADYASTGSGNVAQTLADMGYSPDIPGFHAYPGLRMIESAYLGAEQAKAGSGDSFLAVLAKRLSAHYESARNDSTLKYYLALPTDQIQGFHFETPTTNTKPRPPVTRAIATLADYAEGNAIGGPQAVLRDYLGIPSDQVYDILRNSATTADAITRGANWVPESERYRRFSLLVADIDRAYDGSAQAEKSLDEFRPKNTARKAPEVLADHQPGDRPPFGTGPSNSGGPPSPDTTGGGGAPSHPSSRGRAPNGPVSPGQEPAVRSSGGAEGSSLAITPTNLADEQAGLARYSKFISENYAAPTESFSTGVGNAVGQGIEQGVFEAVVEGIGGFGGIVFGNHVSAAPGLGNLRSLTWIPEESSEPLQRGRLLLDFEQIYNGSKREIRRSYGPVLLEDAYAAYRIVFAPNGMPKWSKGQGIGLMGLYDKERYIHCDAEGSPQHSDYWRILLNPALLNSELGRSAVFVDSIPIAAESFAGILEGGGASEDTADQIGSWLRETPGTWKFIDRQVIIGNIGQRVTVTSVGGLAAERARFIDVESFYLGSAADQDNPFSSGFRKLFPLIVTSSHEFSRINGFAPVLALFRWAKLSGAAIEQPIPAPTKLATPEAILIGDNNSISATADLSTREVRDQVRLNIDSCLAHLTQSFTGPEQEILKQQQLIYRQASIDLEPVNAARGERARLEDRMEYIDNLARSRPRIEGSSPARPLGVSERRSDQTETYDHLQELSDAQGGIIRETTTHVQDELKSALDDQALSDKIMTAAGGDVADQYVALRAKEDGANQDSNQLSAQLQELKQNLLDDEHSCIVKLPTQLHHAYLALQTREAKVAFLGQHCAGLAEKEEKADQLDQELSKNHDAAQKANEGWTILLKQALPNLERWSELCQLYLPSSFYLWE